MGDSLSGMVVPVPGGGGVHSFAWPVPLAALDPTGNLQMLAANPAVAATAIVTANTLADGNTVTIGNKTYTFKTTLTGVEGQVLLGASDATALDNLKSAINRTGVPDTDYVAAFAHPQVNATTNTDTTQIVEAKLPGAAGNLIPVAGTVTRTAWAQVAAGVAGAAAVTLTGGKYPTLSDSNSFLYISTNSTYLVKSGPGVLHSIVLGETAAGAITCYDALSAANPIIAVLKASIVEGTYLFDAAFHVGLTIVTAAASKLTVNFR